MQPDFKKIPAFNHFNLVDICSQIVNIWPGWFIYTHIFQKCVIYHLPLINLKYLVFFSRRNWRVLEVQRQIVYGSCARRMRSRIQVGVLKSTSGQCLFNGQANVINKVKNRNFKSKNQY